MSVTTTRPPKTPRATAASPAAEDGSQKTPSSSANERHAATISSSETVTTRAPGRGDLRRVHRLGDADRGGERARAVGGLRGDDRRLQPELRERGRVRGRVPAAAVRDRERVRRAAELLDDLVHRGLLAGDAVRVERVDEDVRAALGKRTRRRQRLVEAAAHLEHARAEHPRLRELPGSDGAFRDEHERRQPGSRCVSRRRRGRVPGRRADHRLGALLDRLRHGDGHPPVLVAPGRVRALPLQPQLDAVALGEPRSGKQRRRALAERDQPASRRRPAASAR